MLGIDNTPKCALSKLLRSVFNQAFGLFGKGNCPFYKLAVLIASVFLIISILIIIGIDVKEVIIEGKEENYQPLYLLSAIAQSLSAILAIVVTLTLIIVQINSRYSTILLEEIIDSYFYAYFGLFVITILIALWQLIETNTTLVKLCLILTSGCLLFLIPFFLYMRERINIKPQLKKLSRMALKKLIHDDNMSKLPEEIDIIENLALVALSNQDFNTFEKAIEAIVDISYKFQISNPDDEFLYKSYKTKSYEMRTILIKLHDISLTYIRDRKVPFLITDQYKKVSEKCIENKINLIPELLCIFMGELGAKAVEERIGELIIWINNRLTQIGFSANHNKRDQISIQVYVAFTNILTKAFELDEIESIKLTLRPLSNFVENAVLTNQTDVPKYYVGEFKKTCEQLSEIRLWDDYALLVIDQYEIALRALLNGLDEIAEISINNIKEEDIDKIKKRSPNYIIEVGVDLILLGSLASHKGFTDYKEITIQLLNKLQSQSTPSQMKKIAELSLRIAGNYEIDGFEEDIKSLISQLNPE